MGLGVRVAWSGHWSKTVKEGTGGEALGSVKSFQKRVLGEPFLEHNSPSAFLEQITKEQREKNAELLSLRRNPYRQ